MPLRISLNELERKSLRLAGALPESELQLEGVDELIHAPQPLHYDLEVNKLRDGLLVRGDLRLDLNCECARCLRLFQLVVRLRDWICQIPLAGPEAVKIRDESVDLTPYFREDILLAFPQQPLCKPDCQGLTELQKKWFRHETPKGGSKAVPGPWSELDKLKL